MVDDHHQWPSPNHQFIKCKRDLIITHCFPQILAHILQIEVDPILLLFPSKKAPFAEVTVKQRWYESSLTKAIVGDDDSAFLIFGISVVVINFPPQF